MIVPVKPFAQAKSRLSPLLRRPLRATLARALLAHTLDVLVEMKLKSPISIVISRDVMALDIARKKGLATILEDGCDLNTALAEARAWAVQAGAEAVLVLPADLPLLAAGDVQAMIEQVADPPCIVIAPDRRQRGTNALLLRPPDALHFAFGAGSFDEHCAQAETSNVRLSIYRSPALAFDLDTPQDWAALNLRPETLNLKPIRR
ncbi:MAG: 2-phospho-L-lactate guanylyltransferase [Thermoflexales bacterium]|nr:2-phospho-L-lactate guanylyltransferase [Thermoflexales bacterium]